MPKTLGPVELIVPALVTMLLLPVTSMPMVLEPSVIVPAFVTTLLLTPWMPIPTPPTTMAPLLVTALPSPRLTGFAAVIEPLDWTVSVRLFSTPVPKPVTLAPLQVTVLPDCTHAAAAGPAGTTAAASDKANGATRTGHRLALTFALDSTVFVRPAPLKNF